MQIAIIPTCHPDRKHQAKGLCGPCYFHERLRRLGLLHPRQDMTGKVFGKLTVLRRDGVRNNQAMWWCQCSCGVQKSINGHSLRKGAIKSCGCLKCIRPYESLYNYCMFHAEREHPEFVHNLTYEQFLEFTKIPTCHYCEDSVAFVARNINGLRAIRYNLARKDNGVGYCSYNLVVCCKSCNYTKGNRFTYEQFVEIGKVIRSFREP